MFKLILRAMTLLEKNAFFFNLASFVNIVWVLTKILPRDTEGMVLWLQIWY